MYGQLHDPADPNEVPGCIFFSLFQPSMTEFRRKSGDKTDTFQITLRLGDRCKMNCKKTRIIFFGGDSVSTRFINTKVDG